MNKKIWEKPQIFELGIEATEQGNANSGIPDDHYVDGNNKDWWSYPS